MSGDPSPYNDRGQTLTVTSYDDEADRNDGDIVNQIAYAYDGWGNLARQWQSHTADSEVDRDTTPSVQYTYDDGATGNVAKYVRLNKVTYPNDRVLGYNYAAGVDAVMSRLSSIFDDADADGVLDAGETVDASYKYLGLGTVVEENDESAHVKLSYDPAGDNSFTGLDRFGRVVDQIWKEYGGTPTAIDEYRYTYDRAGNRTSKTVVFKTDNSLDETYTYDALDRLTATDRSGGTASDQSWTLDGAGNWSSVTTGGTAENRTQDAANQTATIDSSSANVGYDAAGNMISVPNPYDLDSSLTCTYDAWNRLGKVKAGWRTVAEYQYDGLNRRVVKLTYDNDVLSETRHFYQSKDWQVLEERVETSTDAERQNVWGLRYVDDLVLRDRDISEARDGMLEERFYAMQDANWNVVAIAAPDGEVVERYTYTAYGKCEIRNPDTFVKDDGGSRALNWTSLYTSREFDPETGFYYYRWRYYHADMGRPIGRDPIQADINLYRYVFNNPITETDPSGLAPPYCSADPGYMGIGSMGNQIKQWERERHDKEFASNLAKLKQQLSGCCSSQSDPCKKAQCEKDADALIAGLQKAYQNIYDRGGPSCFSFNGPVCTQCEEQVGNNVRGGDYFGYGTVTHIGPTIPWTDMSVPGTDHAWGEITCKATGKVFTIDFWKGGTDFWRCGPDAFGWKRTSCPPRAR